MREIKFRAWDTLGKVMHYHVENGIYFYFNNITFPFGEILSDERFIVMQYTGLKDKENREIYTGDVIEIDAFGRYEIIFKDGYFQTTYLETQATEFFMFNTKLLLEGNQENRQIIWNIFEHSEIIGDN